MRRKPNGPKACRFHQFQHRAGTWSRIRSVIARVEATALGSDARFVVTSLNGRGKTLYDKVYCARGRMENLIKDLKLDTRADKTACHRWQANQFRLFLHVGAYWLLHSMRRALPRHSHWRGATFETIRRAFVKIAVRREDEKSDQNRLPGELSVRAYTGPVDRLHCGSGAVTSSGGNCARR